MATDKVVARKNGQPVKRFWREKVTAKGRETWSTTYPVYFHGLGMRGASLTDERALRTLEEAESIAKHIVESPDTEWTMAVVYELRAVVRYGTEIDHKALDQEQRATLAAVGAPVTFKRVATTSSD